jgi:tetratricopeptide (TPR) repeat protein
VKQIGRDLNVRYALEGSVQRGSNRMRVNVQLIGAETGSHLWGERFDKPVADLFDMQDEIVAHLANRLGQELARAEARRAERSANPDSMDHYFLGIALRNKGVTAEFLDKARSHFDRALDLDPANVDALVERAWIDVIFAANYLSNDRAERHRTAESDLGKALRLRPDNASAHCALGVLRMYSNRAAQGIGASAPWQSTEIWPSPTHGLVWRCFLPAATTRLSGTFSKRCASARATLVHMAGCTSSERPN